jgi:myo-inositol-1(or 4)-monophosphatase
MAESAEDELDLLVVATRASRDLLREGFGRGRRLSQLGRDIKLDEDRRSQAIIVEALQRGSSHPILTEESGWVGAPAAAGQPYWVIDPLDGSFNYVRGIPLFCVSVALCRDLEPVLGCTFDVMRDEVFAGGPGLGATVNGERVVPPAPATEIIATGFPSAARHDEEALLDVVRPTATYAKMRMIGSAALSLAWVASGRRDAYRETGIRWWDVAAGLALVSATGGSIHVEGSGPTDLLRVEAHRRVTEPGAS